MCHDLFSVEDVVVNKRESLTEYSLDFSDKIQMMDQ